MRSRLDKFVSRVAPALVVVGLAGAPQVAETGNGDDICNPNEFGKPNFTPIGSDTRAGLVQQTRKGIESGEVILAAEPNAEDGIQTYCDDTCEDACMDEEITIEGSPHVGDTVEEACKTVCNTIGPDDFSDLVPDEPKDEGGAGDDEGGAGDDEGGAGDDEGGVGDDEGAPVCEPLDEGECEVTLTEENPDGSVVIEVHNPNPNATNAEECQTEMICVPTDEHVADEGFGAEGESPYNIGDQACDDGLEVGNDELCHAQDEKCGNDGCCPDITQFNLLGLSLAKVCGDEGGVKPLPSGHGLDVQNPSAIELVAERNRDLLAIAIGCGAAGLFLGFIGGNGVGRRSRRRDESESGNTSS